MHRFALLLVLFYSCLHAGESALNAVTYNIRNDNKGDRHERNWNQRKARVTDYLLKTQASVIGLQEVKHNQLVDMERALADFSFVGVGRDDGKTHGEYSPIFYDRKIWRLDPAQHGTFWLSDTPGKIASRSWGNTNNRICTWARFIHINSNKAVYVFNTHWDHRSQPSRVNSASLILKKIRTRQNPHEPFILMGDFNATTGNAAIRALLSSGILIDPGKKQFQSSSHWQAGLVAGERIDHIFVPKKWHQAVVVVQSNDDGKYSASDHHPVLLTVSPNPFSNKS